MLEVGASTGAHRRPTTQLVTQAARGCPDQCQCADRGVSDRNRKRDDGALAMPHDPRARQVQLASGPHRAQGVASVVDAGEQIARRPVPIRLAAAARVVAKRRHPKLGQRFGQA